RSTDAGRRDRATDPPAPRAAMWRPRGARGTPCTSREPRERRSLRSLLQLGEQLFRGRVLLVVVERALQHLQGLLVVTLHVADFGEVVEDLSLRDRRAVVQLLQEQRAERLLGAVDVRVLRGLFAAFGRAELEREDAEVTENCHRAGVNLEGDVELAEGLVLL